MAIRTWKDVSIATAGTAAPAVGTTLTAAVAPVTNPALGDERVQLPVADSTFGQVKKGDHVLVMETDGTKAERHKVVSVDDATHITIAKLENTHASGAFVILAIPINSFYLQTKDGNSGTLWVGNRRDMNTGTGLGVIAELTKVAAGGQPSEMTDSRNAGYNPGMSSDYWVDGTNTDKYRVQLGVV